MGHPLWIGQHTSALGIEPNRVRAARVAFHALLYVVRPGWNPLHWVAHTALPWAINQYEHDPIVKMIVNGVVVSLAVAACPESAGLTCAVGAAFAAGGAMSTLHYRVSNRKRSSVGYAASFVVGGGTAALFQGSQGMAQS
jgi:hypothetical protein